MAWTDDVRRANETLDWIEARQGPLPESGYARIETDVRTVRAMAEGQDDARVQEIRARLEAATPGPWQTWPDGTEESVESVSVGRFVCHLNSNMRQFRDDAAFIAHARQDVPWLLARLDALEAERDYLESGFKTLLEVGKTQRDRARKAEAERDVLRVERDIARRVEQESSAAADAWQAEAVKVQAEWDAAVARAEARLAAAESALWAVGVPLINNVMCWCQESRDMAYGHSDACRQANAALAGSREQAAEGEGA